LAIDLYLWWKGLAPRYPQATLLRRRSKIAR